jgi:hypothetical protein
MLNYADVLEAGVGIVADIEEARRSNDSGSTKSRS